MRDEAKEVDLLPHLKPDIWDQIILSVKRPRPMGGTPTKWKDLHQEGFSKSDEGQFSELCSRVASIGRTGGSNAQAFNAITARHLYNSVVTHDLPLFTVGSEQADHIIDRKSSTKLDLLGLIRRLFLEDRLWEMMGTSWEEVDAFNKAEWDDRERPPSEAPYPCLGFLGDDFVRVSHDM